MSAVLELGCACVAPADFEELMAVDLGLDDPCCCDPKVCAGGLVDTREPERPLVVAAAALAHAVRAGLPVTGVARPDRAMRAAEFERQVLSSVVRAYELEGDVAGAQSARCRLEEFERQQAAPEARSVCAWAPSGLLEQLSGPVEETFVCCRAEASGGGPLRVQEVDGGWDVTLPLTSPEGLVRVGPVRLAAFDS